MCIFICIMLAGHKCCILLHNWPPDQTLDTPGLECTHSFLFEGQDWLQLLVTSQKIKQQIEKQSLFFFILTCLTLSMCLPTPTLTWSPQSGYSFRTVLPSKRINQIYHVITLQKRIIDWDKATIITTENHSHQV